MNDFSIRDLFHLPWNADELLAAWLTSLRESDNPFQFSEAELDELEDWIQSDEFNPFRHKIDVHFNDQLNCVFDLSARALASTPELSQDKKWCEWLAGVSKLRALRGSQRSLEEVFDEDRWLSLFVIASLVQVLPVESDQHHVSETIIRRLEQSQESYPLPPGNGCSVSPHDYCHRSEFANWDQFSDILDTLGEWDDDELDRLSDELESQGCVEHNVAELAHTRDLLSPLLQFFHIGWPINRARLADLSQGLIKSLSDGPDPTSGLLRGQSVTIERLESLIMSLEPTTLASNQSPTDDRDRQVQLGPSRRIRSIAEWLGQQSCILSQRYVLDLRNLATTLGQSLGRDLPRIGKDLVNLMIGLDALVAKRYSGTEILEDLGQQLRTILVEEFSYKILQLDDLAGRSLHAFSGQVKVHRAVRAVDRASDEIVAVHTPGYLLEYPNGRVDVVKLAEVIIAE